LNIDDLERGQGSGAFKTVDCTGTKVQEVNQVKLGGYYSNKGRLYTVDRGKSIISKGRLSGKEACPKAVSGQAWECRCVGVGGHVWFTSKRREVL
jgi:hypothetical protein